MPIDRPQTRDTRTPSPIAALLATLLLMLSTSTAQAFRLDELSPEQRHKLSKHFKTVLYKRKGPYTPNYCICLDGEKKPVMADDGSIANRCGSRNTRFCAAFRAPWAEALTEERLYLGNIFSSDLYDWDRIPNHHDLVRGYILEKFFVDTHPDHKLTEMKGFGGLSGAEYEARDMPLFFERYLSSPDFDDSRHFLLAYELQKRFFVRNDNARIQDIRNLASRIYHEDKGFKPLRDATHNRVSAALIPRLEAFRDYSAENDRARADIDKLIAAIRQLTRLDGSSIEPQLAALEDQTLARELRGLLPAADAPLVDAMQRLGRATVRVRQAVATGRQSPADRRRLVDLDVGIAALMQSQGLRLVNEDLTASVAEHLQLIGALADAAFGTGLLTAREHAEASRLLEAMLKRPETGRETFRQDLKRLERLAEWAHNSAMLAFGEVLAPWASILPDVIRIGDDIVRGSPILLLASLTDQLGTYLAGDNQVRHQLFGRTYTADVRVLNPGLALGRLRVAPKENGYDRNDVVALPETPADLKPAAGILTRGEGNVVSHVQLLARALGIPNVLLSQAAYESVKAHDGQEVFMVVTPGGRLYMKRAADMTEQNKAVLHEFTKGREVSGDGDLAGSAAKLHIDVHRLDVEQTAPLPLEQVRRKDSGILSGPKAAFLGELKHLFPDHVARGVVVPFGAYLAHFRSAPVTVPKNLQKKKLAKEGESLYAFAERTYDHFFKRLVPKHPGEKKLAEWIRPRLEIIRHSIQQQPLAPALREEIRQRLADQGLLQPDDPTQTRGCFVRSDTNVEDQDDFNGAGLNLTLFNLKSLEDIYRGILEVWASPFTYRSFSWRQTLIDEPLWVLPSIVILESIHSEKSGVLVTADIDNNLPGRMLIATSEGVGGAVDGTPAETLLWSPAGVELLTQFKSPTRRLLKPDGGSEIVPSTGRDNVLEPAELEALVAAGQKIIARLAPARDATGKPRAWDIEYGFVDGKLWLFQVRPFIGNETLQNSPALAALESGKVKLEGSISLKEEVK